MACDLCKELPIHTMRQIDEAISEGSKSVGEIAEQFYLSSSILEEHMRSCVAPLPSSGHELLTTILRDVRESAEERKRHYDTDPEENSHAMGHYINLVREAREIILAMERIRPSDELAQEIVRKVVNPIIRQCVVTCVDEGNRLRDELVSALGQENFEAVDAAVKRSLRRFAERLKGESGEVIERLPEILASDNGNQQKSKPLTPSLESPSDPSESIH